MNLHFASSPSRIHLKVLRESGAKKLLFSYAFIKNPESLAKMLRDNDIVPERMILDSGAFSVWSRGGTVNLEEYAQFCKAIQGLLPKETKLFIVNLDVLPGKWGFVPTQQEIAESAEKGWENMLYLESLGLKVIHVFHQHEDFEILERLKKHSDYFGVSPANDVSMSEKLAWMNKVFANIKNGWKTHGFAVTSHAQLYNFPFYSVDSSSWISPARYGRISVMTDKKEVKSMAYKDKWDIDKYWPYIADMGIEKIASPTWHDRVKISIKTYLKLEQFATELWEKRGVTWNESVDNLVGDSRPLSYN